MKKFILILSIFLTILPAFSEKTSWKADDYQMYVFFNKDTHPGDAIFVRLILETKDKRLMKNITV